MPGTEPILTDEQREMWDFIIQKWRDAVHLRGTDSSERILAVDARLKWLESTLATVRDDLAWHKDQLALANEHCQVAERDLATVTAERDRLRQIVTDFETSYRENEPPTIGVDPMAMCKECSGEAMEGDRLCEKCRTMHRTSSRKSYLKRRESLLSVMSARTYGIDPSEYRAIQERSGGLCELCGRPETAIARDRIHRKALTLDHNHSTGELRGVLCNRCNFIVGWVETLGDLHWLDKVKAYLSKDSSASLKEKSET